MESLERPFEPSLLSKEAHSTLRAVIRPDAFDDPLRMSEALRGLAARAGNRAGGVELDSELEGLRLAAAASVLADLSEQGWKLRVDNAATIWARTPEPQAAEGEDLQSAKARLRSGLLIASDRQLASSSVQEFLKRVERDRVFDNRIVSVKTVIDDGSAILTELDKLVGKGVQPTDALQKIIQPTLEICLEGKKCRFTGIELLDLWRYFRHTWSLEYNSIPGRTLRFLIRNRARPNWPVMGIAMLASPPANLYRRDEWIGWTLDNLVQKVLSREWDARTVGQRLFKYLTAAIGNIRSDDLIPQEECLNPSQQTLFRLNTILAQAEHRRGLDLEHRGSKSRGLVDIRDLEKETLTDGDWRRLSSTALYTKKRAGQLILLLKALMCFRRFGFKQAPAAALYEMLVTKHGRDAINIALLEVRKLRLATEVADIAVCGAVPPYNGITGGKLVALAMISREAREAYDHKYAARVSEIVSQLAGKSVVRSAKLKILTTTSLYGLASGQYKRLKLRASEFDGVGFDLEFKYLGKTEGFTVTHLSKTTVNYMRSLAILRYGRRRINSVFGEGSSPRTRQIREGLNLIGINNDHVLEQGLERRVYACELYPNATADLLGWPGSGKGVRGPTLRAIGKAWVQRWAVKRVQLDDVREQMRAANGDVVAESLRRRAERARLEEESVSSDWSQLELEFSDESLADG